MADTTQPNETQSVAVLRLEQTREGGAKKNRHAREGVTLRDQRFDERSRFRRALSYENCVAGANERREIDQQGNDIQQDLPSTS